MELNVVQVDVLCRDVAFVNNRLDIRGGLELRRIRPWPYGNAYTIRT